jgi:hypothetical protein
VCGGGHCAPGSIDTESVTRSHAGVTYFNDRVAKRSNLRIVTEALVGKILLSSAKPVTITGVFFK